MGPGTLSFARSLRDLPDDELTILLARRSDAAEVTQLPRPTWMDLARALLRPRAVALTVARLDRFLGQVLQLACLEGGRLAHAAAAAEGLAAGQLDAAVRELRRWGLAATDRDGSLVVPAIVATVLPDPGGLGPPAARLLEALTAEELRQIAMRHGLSGVALPKRKADLSDALHARLTDRDGIRARIAAAPPAAREALEALRRAGGTNRGGRAGKAWERPYYSWASWGAMRQQDARDGVDWLVMHGIVLPMDAGRGSVALPSEVERALRDRVFARWEATTPVLETAPLREERHPVDIVVAMETLLEGWRHAPPPALKEGGAPKREIKRAAGRVGWSEEDAGRLVTLAFAAGLLAERELVPEKRSRSWRNPRVLQSRQAAIEPSADAERWLALSEPERWLELARVWIGAVAGAGSVRASAVSREQLVLRLLAEIDEDRGASARSTGRALSWRHPAVFPDAAAAAALADAIGRALASIGAGAADPVVGLSAAGRLMLSGAGVEELRHAFPPPADRCVVTADQRVVVSGPPHGDLAAMLRRIAEVASARPARVYRITEASLARAFDGGLTATRILEVLGRHASEPLPSNVVALIEDVARRHGRVRVGTAGVYVVADDPVRLETVARDRAVGGDRLRRIAPTVAVIEGRDQAEVMAALRRAGLMPVADGASPPAEATAGPAPAARAPHRQPAPRAAADTGTLDAAATARLVAALRAAPSPMDRIGPEPRPEDAVRAALGEAIRRHRPVEIGILAASGALEIAVAVPYQFFRDTVYVQDARRYRAYELDLHRILWAEPAEGGLAGIEGDALENEPEDDADDLDDALFSELTPRAGRGR